MATLLTRLRINEVSSVDRGAGKNVKVFLTKRAEDAMAAICKECGGLDGMHKAACSKYEKAAPVDAYVMPATVGELRELGASAADVLEAVAYLKREFSGQERERLAGTGAAMPGGGFPIQNEGDLRNAIRAIGRAKNPGAAKTHIKQRARSLGLTRMLPDSWEKRDSGHADEAQDRKLIAEMLADRDEKKRKSAMSGLIKAATDAEVAPPVVAAVRKAFSGAIASAHEVEDDGARLAAVSKSLDQCLEYLAAAVPEASSTAFNAAVAAISKGNDMTATKTLDELTAGLEKLAKRNGYLEALLKLAEPHRAYMDLVKMTDEDREVFVGKSAEERDVIIKAKPAKKDDGDDDGDETDKRKRDQAKLADMEKRLRAFEAEAEERICKALCRDNGLPESDHAMLAAVRKNNPKEADELLKRTRGLAAQANPTLFAELGKGGAGTDDPTAAIMAKADQMMIEINKSAKTAAERISIQKARMLVREQNPELAKAEREIEQRRRMGRAA